MITQGIYMINDWPDKSINECTDEELLLTLEKISNKLSERNQILRKIRTGDIGSFRDDIKTVADILTTKPKK